MVSKIFNEKRFYNGPEIGGESMGLIDCVKNGYARNAARCIEQDGADVNFQDNNGMTALHHAVVNGARNCLRVLVNSGKCDYLLRDNHGQYASMIAFQKQDYAVGVLLSKKQVMQDYEWRAPVFVPK